MINTKKINEIGQEVNSTQASVFDEVVREGDIWIGDTWSWWHLSWDLNEEKVFKEVGWGREQHVWEPRQELV